MAQVVLKDSAVTLNTAAAMAKLETPEIVGPLCDAVFADLSLLCKEIWPRGMEAVDWTFNYPYSDELCAVSFNWRPPQDSRSWYHGSYVGFELNPSHRSGLGFLAKPIVREIERRLKAARTSYYAPRSRSITGIDGTVWIDNIVYQTLDGIFLMSHIHSWRIMRQTTAT